MKRTINKALSAIYFFCTAPLLAAEYEPPRTQSGKPDLQGYWTNASLTKMERDPNYAEYGLVFPSNLVPELTADHPQVCLLYTSPSPRDLSTSRMPSSA